MSTCSSEERITIALADIGDNGSSINNYYQNEIHVRLESVTKASRWQHPLLAQHRPDEEEAPIARIFANESSSIRSLSIYIASESTKVMPSLRLFQDATAALRTGPSGILVQVDFDLSKTTAAVDRPPHAQETLELFYALLVDLVDAKVLPGPFGLSLRRHRLHRQVECTIFDQCTAHIPIEGAHTAASAESFRQFLQPSSSSTTGVFSLASPYEWSSWWMGKTSQTLDDAANIMAASGLDHTAIDDNSNAFLPIRPARWMDWTRTCTGHSNTNNCQWILTKGIQYNILVRNLVQKLDSSIPLSSLLPTDKSSILSIDPFADTTVIELVQTGRNKIAMAETEQLRDLGQVASSTPSTRFHHYTPTRTNLDLSRVFLHKDNQSDTTTTTTTTSLPDKYSTGRCSVHSRLLRDRGGQANTGTFELYLEHSCGSCQVKVRQHLPAFVSPIWRSLKVFVDDQRVPFHDLQREGSHIHFYDNGSSYITLVHTHNTNGTSLRLLLDYDPVFLSIDSFPGNANRGFEIPSARASFQCAAAAAAADPMNTTKTIHLYTDAQLVLSPLPDMSMPFNVISLTCTFYAFVVGSILNLAIKKAGKHIKDQLDPDKAEPDSIAGKIKAKVILLCRGLYQRLRQRAVAPSSMEQAGDEGLAHEHVTTQNIQNE